MKKIQKIVEAKALIKDKAGRIDKGLSKLLTVKEIKSLEPELGLLRQALKLLEIKLITIDSSLKNKLSNME